MSKEHDEFKWNDELVKEFAWRFLNNFPSVKLPESINEFKQSKQPKREWEIVSFRHIDYGIMFRQDDGYFHHISSHGRGWCISESDALKRGAMSIFSVKRLSDSEVFSMGDRIQSKTRLSEPFTITTIEIINNSAIYLDACPLQNAEPRNKVLFTTEDGVGINIGDKFWAIDTVDWEAQKITAQKTFISPYSIFQTFSTKEKAEEYILLHKPCLSVNDVKECCMKQGDEPSMKLIKQLAKEKINK